MSRHRGVGRQAGPARLAFEREYDHIRRTIVALERAEPGAGEGLAAQAAEALRAVNLQRFQSDGQTAVQGASRARA